MKHRIAGQLALTAALLALAVMAAEAQSFPSRPVTIVVPYGPGGPADIMARILAERMRASLGQPVIIENVAGAAGTIAVSRVVRALPDGLTLSYGNWGTHVLNGAIQKVSYDVLTDLEPVALLPDNPYIAVTNPAVPAQNFQELMAWLKANPDKANYPTPSPVFTLPIEHFKIKTGAPATAISYRSSNESITSLLGGQTAFGFVETPVSVPQLGSGNLRALAVTSTSRNPEVPNVPTLAEAGVPDVVGGTYLAMMAPASTPAPIIKKLETACREMVVTDDFKARMKNLAATPIGSTADELTAHMRDEVRRWSAVVKEANIKFEQ